MNKCKIEKYSSTSKIFCTHFLFYIYSVSIPKLIVVVISNNWRSFSPSFNTHLQVEWRNILKYIFKLNNFLFHYKCFFTKKNIFSEEKKTTEVLRLRRSVKFCRQKYVKLKTHLYVTFLWCKLYSHDYFCFCFLTICFLFSVQSLV